MNGPQKNKEAILKKLGIYELNPMQHKAHETIASRTDTLLLSPTGTGKTLAFLLPILEHLNSQIDEVQVLILVPSRELAIQLEQVFREMGSGHKVNAVYGGRPGAKDKIELKKAPRVLIGTPGRVADHFRKGTIAIEHITTLVLDEFDKSLEIGFEKEMKEILSALPYLEQKILTSATRQIEIPSFVGLYEPTELNFINKESNALHLRTITTPTKEKTEVLMDLLHHLGDAKGILFCNFKDAITELSQSLLAKGIAHSCFHGDLEQMEREYSLIKFRNGTHRLLLATDLAARGIDVPALDYIIHYQVPSREDAFIHRNGRTARMHEKGSAYILKRENEALPEFIKAPKLTDISSVPHVSPASSWLTLTISGGRKDKISKGDIAGFFLKQGKLKKEELGTIELKHDRAFVAIPFSKADFLINTLNNQKLKTKKVRIALL